MAVEAPCRRLLDVLLVSSRWRAVGGAPPSPALRMMELLWPTSSRWTLVFPGRCPGDSPRADGRGIIAEALAAGGRDAITRNSGGLRGCAMDSGRRRHAPV